MPRGEAALDRRTAARKLAVIMGRLCEAHGNASADRGRQADEEGLPGILCRKGSGKDRCERRNRAIHQPSQPRLNVGQDELSARRLRPPPREHRPVRAFHRACGRAILVRLVPRLPGRPAACASPHPGCAPPPRHRSGAPVSSIASASARALRRSAVSAISHSGLRSGKSRTCSRRISGIRLPKRCTCMSISHCR